MLSTDSWWRRSAYGLLAGLLALGIAAPLVAMSPKADDTPQVSVRFWNDRVVDGTYNTSKQDAQGRTDELNSSGYVYLRDAEGAWWSTTIDEDGLFSFPGVAEGEATVLFTLANPRGTVMDGDDEHLKRTDEHGGQDVTYLDPDSGEQIPARIPNATFFEGTVTVSASGDAEPAEFRNTLVMNSATVSHAGEASPDLAEVAFTNNDVVFDSMRAASGAFLPLAPGTENTQQAFGASQMGVQITPDAGYAVESVTASNDAGQLRVTDNGGGHFTVQTEDLATSFDTVRWEVALADAPPTSLTVDYWSDRVVDGVYDTSVSDVDGRTDERPSSGYVYLRDADGSWWSTSPGEDGRFTFTGIAPGEAKVFFTVPNDQMTVMDADDEHLARTDSHGGRDATYLDPDDGSHVPARIPQGVQLYEGTAQVDESADDGGRADAAEDPAEFRSSLVRSQAELELDGERVGEKHAQVEFGNNDDWFAAGTDDDGLLFYPEAADGSGTQAFGAHTASLRVEAADGYEVESVTATADDDTKLSVSTGDDGTYTVETAELPTSFSVVGWEVELVESEDQPSEPGPTDPEPPGEPSPDDPGPGDEPDKPLPGTGATLGLVLIVAALLAVGGGTALMLRRRQR